MTAPRDDDNGQDLDRLMEKDGGDIGALYRRLARLEPPRRLDRAVLGEAARAVRGRAPRRHRWLVGFGSAAGLVLAAGVAWHVGQDALQRQTSDSARRGMIVVPVEPITGAPHKGAPTENIAEHEPAPMPPPTSDAARRAAQPIAARPKRQSIAPPPPRPAPTRAQTQPVSPVPAAAPSQEQSAADNAAATTPSAAIRQDRAGGTPDKTAPRHQPAFATAAPSSSIELRRDMQLAPDEWLAHIRELLRQGRRQQAAESLSLFRRMHPELVLPADLNGLPD